jgi:hypothetical protein
MPAPGGVWFGGDYNPEQWDEKVWVQDDALMREAGVNTATVGVFSWSVLEPDEGRYEFGWLDATLDRLWHNGIRVVLATPTGHLLRGGARLPGGRGPDRRRPRGALRGAPGPGDVARAQRIRHPVLV